MDYGTLERELHIDASPEVVFDVVSNPAHVREWWPDEADYPATPGGAGHISFGENVMQFQVVDAEPYRLFSFRWTHEEGQEPAKDNSMLVVFELEPSGTGTHLRMTETGFRERGWDEAKVVADYSDHVSGWDSFLPRLAAYAPKVGADR